MQSSLYNLKIKKFPKMTQPNKPDYEILLLRDSSSRYSIGNQGYGIGSNSKDIPERIKFDLREAGIEAGREHYTHMARLPGQIRVRKIGRKIEVSIE